MKLCFFILKIRKHIFGDHNSDFTFIVNSTGQLYVCGKNDSG